MSYHSPVLLEGAIRALNIDPEGVYVDVTYGGGGHSKLILESLKGGKLVAFDQDLDAGDNVVEDDRLVFVRQNFKHLKKYLRLYSLLPVNGVLADLGVSSHQLDVPERGFSYRFDADLDMRMDNDGELTARQIVNEYSQADLIRVFKEYGEIRNARALSNAIVNARSGKEIERISELLSAIRPFAHGNPNKFFSKVFQALRIEVNKELEVLEALLEQMLDVLCVGGRMVVISYHSLEDRLVKNFMKTGNVKGQLVKDVFGKSDIPVKMLSKKPIIPSDDELKVNPRSRSAKMRIAEKVK